MSRARDASPPIGLWALALGAVGFASGFFGPIALNPDANQGPLLGIFITGPGGALFGLAAGVAARLLPLTPAQRWQALGIACASAAAGILFFCLPGPERRARLVDVQVQACESPAAVADAAIADWETRIRQVTWSPPRRGWKRDVARMLAADPGVVLEVTVTRSRDVFENRKPWNRGSLFARAWQPSGERERFFARFAGADCDAYRDLGPRVYLPASQGTRQWPPELLPNFLGLQVLGEVAPPYRRFAGE